MDADAYPLIQALLHDPTEAQNLLEATPSLISARTGTGETALHYLAIESRIDAVRWLLERGADANCADDFGDRPLYSASLLGNDAMVSLLLEHGADVEATRNDGETALHAASRGNHPDVMQLLLDAGAAMEARTDLEETPLLLAASNGAIDAVQLLIDRGADVNWPGAFKQTPLHCATNVAVAEALLEAGADLHALDCNGATVLHAAARSGNDALCAIFVQLGLDPGARDDEGRTVEDERIRGERLRPKTREMMAPLEDAMRALQQHLEGQDVDVPDLSRLMDDTLRKLGIDPEEPPQ